MIIVRKTMKIKQISKIESKPVFDITVENRHTFLIGDSNIITHNSIFPKTIMGGGQGIMLAANTVFCISQSQDKDGKDLLGYNFTLIAEESRFVREKSRIPVTVKFEGGIERWSGMFDIVTGKQIGRAHV